MAVLDRIASDLASAPGKLFRKNKRGNDLEIDTHPFLDFWDHPNPLYEYTCPALWRLFEIYLLLKGEGYFLIERDGRDMPSELWPIPVHWVYMTPYIGHPTYTIRTPSGEMLEIDVEDMFVMKQLNPLDPSRRGLGPAEALADEVETDEYASKFQKRFFFNDATPSFLISMPDSNDEQRKRFLAQWKERFQGVFNSHGVATVDGTVKVDRLTESVRDIDMVSGRTYLRNAVLEHFGVPREIMGITESSNRATSESAQYIYAQNVLMPRLLQRQDAINRQLIPMFGDEGLEWRYDNIVPRNQEFDMRRAIDGWNAGILTLNESRELMDHSPVANGDVRKEAGTDILSHWRVREGGNPCNTSALP